MHMHMHQAHNLEFMVPQLDILLDWVDGWKMNFVLAATMADGTQQFDQVTS